MTTTTMFDAMVATGLTTREEVDTFFVLLSIDTLENQIAMTLTPNNDGSEYTTVGGKHIKVIE